VLCKQRQLRPSPTSYVPLKEEQQHRKNDCCCSLNLPAFQALPCLILSSSYQNLLCVILSHNNYLSGLFWRNSRRGSIRKSNKLCWRCLPHTHLFFLIWVQTIRLILFSSSPILASLWTFQKSFKSSSACFAAAHYYFQPDSDFLDHKSLDSTEIYINIERTMFKSFSDEFTVKVTEKPEEMKTPLETGFEYICQKDSLVFLRKRK